MGGNLAKIKNHRIARFPMSGGHIHILKKLQWTRKTLFRWNLFKIWRISVVGEIWPKLKTAAPRVSPKRGPHPHCPWRTLFRWNLSKIWRIPVVWGIWPKLKNHRIPRFAKRKSHPHFKKQGHFQNPLSPNFKRFRNPHSPHFKMAFAGRSANSPKWKMNRFAEHFGITLPSTSKKRFKPRRFR